MPKFHQWSQQIEQHAASLQIPPFHERELRPYYYDGVSVEDTVKELAERRGDFDKAQTYENDSATHSTPERVC